MLDGMPGFADKSSRCCLLLYGKEATTVLSGPVAVTFRGSYITISAICHEVRTSVVLNVFVHVGFGCSLVGIGYDVSLSSGRRRRDSRCDTVCLYANENEVLLMLS